MNNILEDKLYLIRNSEYSKWFVNMLKKQMTNMKITYSHYNVLKMMQLVELDNIEQYLLNKYWSQFTEIVTNMILDWK